LLKGELAVNEMKARATVMVLVKGNLGINEEWLRALTLVRLAISYDFDRLRLLWSIIILVPENS